MFTPISQNHRAKFFLIKIWDFLLVVPETRVELDQKAIEKTAILNKLSVNFVAVVSSDITDGRFVAVLWQDETEFPSG